MLKPTLTKSWADMTQQECETFLAARDEYEKQERVKWDSKLLQKIFDENVPMRYQDADIQTLTPSELSHMPLVKQEKIINLMRLAPDAGYCFFSPSGWSKSTFLYALYRHALLNNGINDKLADLNLHPVVVTHAKTLADKIVEWKCDRAGAPSVTANKIEQLANRGIKTHLFIDEFEKVKKTEFGKVELYDILHACYQHKAQLVIAGNMTKADLEDNDQYLEGTFRRVEDLTAPYFWEWK